MKTINKTVFVFPFLYALSKYSNNNKNMVHDDEKKLSHLGTENNDLQHMQ